MAFINLIVTIAFASALLVSAFEEDNQFCIHTESAFLREEEHVIPNKTETHCQIVVTTLTVQEKENFLHTMCKDHANTLNADYHYFRLRNGDLTGRGSYHEICKDKTNFLLAWIPYDMLKEHYAHELNPKERANYIAKAMDLASERTELCNFPHSELILKAHSNLFSCTALAKEDTIYGVDAHINVLIEIQPIMYEIRNITYLPWMNVSASYKTVLGRTTLKNPSRGQKQIYGSINYAYVEKVKLNVSSVYAEHLEALPVLFEHKGAVLEMDNSGVGGLEIKDKTYFGRVMDARTHVQVDVIGQWAKNQRHFNADIYDYFGYGIKRFRQELHHGAVAFVCIASTEPVYETPESTLLANVTLHGTEEEKQKFQRLTEHDHHSLDNFTTHGGSLELEEEFETRGGHPYPEFYPWFVASALIVGLTLLIAVIGMVRACSKDEHKQKHKYKLTNA